MEFIYDIFIVMSSNYVCDVIFFQSLEAHHLAAILGALTFGSSVMVSTSEIENGLNQRLSPFSRSQLKLHKRERAYNKSISS